MANDKIINLDDNSFEAAINGELPVLVHFFASWFPPCRAISGLLDELADDYEGRITICELNMDDNQDTPLKYDVRDLPILLIFKDGQVISRMKNAQPAPLIRGFIENVL